MVNTIQSAILATVSTALNVPVEVIRGGNRSTKFTYTRRIFIQLCIERMSGHGYKFYDGIAGEINRSRAIVNHHIRKHDEVYGKPSYELYTKMYDKCRLFIKESYETPKTELIEELSSLYIQRIELEKSIRDLEISIKQYDVIVAD